MRLTALALVAVLGAAGCGGDEPEEQPQTTPQPAPQRTTPDTSLGDTTGAMSGQAGQTGRADGQAARPGQPGQGGQQATRPGGRTGAAGGAAGATGGATGASGGDASAQRLYTVQVAAFTEPNSATEWAGRLRSQGLPVWTSMAELGGRTFYRVRVGAVPTVSEARRLGNMLSQRYEWPVWVAPITPADRPPQNAVQQTRSTLQGG